MLLPPGLVTSHRANSPYGVATSAQAIFALRLVNLSYAGALINVRRSSDNTTMDIGVVSGKLDTATLMTFCGSGSGYVTCWYDQSGAGLNAVQANTGAQPQIVQNGAVTTQNGYPAVYYNGNNIGLVAPFDFTATATTTIAAVNINTGGYETYLQSLNSGSRNVSVGWSNENFDLQRLGSSDTAQGPSVGQNYLNLLSIFGPALSGGTYTINYSESGSLKRQISLGGYGGVGNQTSIGPVSGSFTGWIAEIAFWSVQLPIAQRSAAEVSMGAALGVTVYAYNPTTVYGGESATAAYALRVVGDGYTGPLIRVQLNNTNLFKDIGAVNGELDTATLLAFAGSGSAYLVTWYDQTGQLNDLTYGTNQPFIVNNGSLYTIGGKPTVQFSGAQMWAPFNFLTGPFTVTSTLQISGNNYESLTGAQSTSGSSVSVGFSGSTFDLMQNGTSDNNNGQTISANAPNVITYIASSTFAGGNFTVAGYAAGVSRGTMTLSYPTGTAGYPATSVGKAYNGDDSFGGYISELVYFPTALSSALRSPVEQSMGANVGVSIYVPPEPTAVGQHLWWRLQLEASASGAFAMSEIVWRSTAGGPQVATGGSPYADQSYGGANGQYGPASAYDGNINTLWSSNDATVGQAFGYQFAQYVDILEIKITARNDSYYTQCPTAFNVQSSDDGATWTTRASFTGVSWSTPGQSQTFEVPAATS